MVKTLVCHLLSQLTYWITLYFLPLQLSLSLVCCAVSRASLDLVTLRGTKMYHCKGEIFQWYIFERCLVDLVQLSTLVLKQTLYMPHFIAILQIQSFLEIVFGNAVSSNSKGTIFSSSICSHFACCHILIILVIFKLFHYYYICYSDLWC